MGQEYIGLELDEDISLKRFLKDFLRQKVNSERELVIT